MRLGLHALAHPPARNYALAPSSLGPARAGIDLDQAPALADLLEDGVITQELAMQMILVDANLLLDAVNTDLPQHAKARGWRESVLSDDQIIRAPWVMILAFARLTTSPLGFEQPLPVERACGYIEEWLSLPGVRIVVPGEGIGQFFMV